MLKWIPFIFILLFLIITLIFSLIRTKRNFFQTITILCAGIYVFFIARICFAPVTFAFTSPHHIHYFLWNNIIFNLIPFQSLDTAFWLNVLMTVPAGVFYRLILNPKTINQRFWLGVGTGLTLEGTQLIINLLVHLGRWIEVDDVITNACGVWIGMLLMYLISKTVLNRLILIFKLR